MSPGPFFVLFLLLTIVLLVGVTVSGYAQRRPVHFALVGLTLASLGATIFFAEQLGGLYDLEAAGPIYDVHLLLAKVTVAAYVLPVVSGILVIRRPGSLFVHRRIAFLVVGLTLVTAITGTWMLLAAEPLELGRVQREAGTESFASEETRTASTCPTNGSSPDKRT